METDSDHRDPGGAADGESLPPSRFGVFPHCPHCDGPMRAEHAHYRCCCCGWRDSCCD